MRIFGIYMLLLGMVFGGAEDDLLKSARHPDSEIKLCVGPVGVNYARVIECALDGADPGKQERAWKLLIWIQQNGGLDGAAGDAWSVDMENLSKAVVMDVDRLGKFYERLSDRQVEAKLFFSLARKIDYAGMSEAEKDLFKAKYPKLLSVILFEPK